MAVQIQFRRDTSVNWSTNNPILAQGELGLETNTGQFKIGDGVQTWSALSYGGLIGPAQTNSIQDYGNGEDGDVTLSAGVTTLTQDMFYNNLTLSGTAQLRTNGFRVFIKNNLDITNAQAMAIVNFGGDGANSSTQTGAGGGSTYTAATLGAATVGGSGATGTTGAGAQAAATTAVNPSNGGGSGAGGAGGNGTPNAGGASRAGATATVPTDFGRFTYEIIRGVALIGGGAGGPGGSAGGGDGVNLARGGGGGGAGGGILYVAAKNIIKGVSTPAKVFCACGGRGGNATAALAGNVGGSGGGGGGGGGYVVLFYETLSGPAVTDLLDASGGDGGIGGNATGTGIGGTGGTGGTGGRIRVHRTLDRTGNTTIGAAGVAGGAGVGTLGGAAGAGGACKKTL